MHYYIQLMWCMVIKSKYPDYLYTTHTSKSVASKPGSWMEVPQQGPGDNSANGLGAKTQEAENHAHVNFFSILCTYGTFWHNHTTSASKSILLQNIKFSCKMYKSLTTQLLHLLTSTLLENQGTVSHSH